MKIRNWVTSILLGLWVPVLLVWVWYRVSIDSTNPYFPPLPDIWARFQENWVFALVPIHVVPSLRNLLIGYLIAVAVSIPLGVIVGASKSGGSYVEPVIDFVRSIPPVALVPIFILLLGLDSNMRIAAVAFSASFPILLSGIDAVKATNSVLLDTAHVFHLSKRQVLWRVRTPNAMPQIFAGLQVAFQVAFVVTIASEILGSGFGLGAFTLIAADSFMIIDAWTGVMLLGLLGYLLNLVFDIVERRSLRWYFGQKKLS